MNGIHYCKILTSVVLTWDLKKYCIRCRWNDGHTNTCEAHLPLQKNLTNNVKTFFLVWCNIKIKSKATKFLLPSKTNSVSGMKYLKQLRGDRQQIVVAHNIYKLFLFISLICLGRYGHLQSSPRILYPPLFQVNEYEYNLCVI